MLKRDINCVKEFLRARFFVNMWSAIVCELLLLSFLGTCISQFTLPNNPVKDALFLHNFVSSNLTLRDCVFRPGDINTCPDPDVRYILYTNGQKQVVDYLQSDWLRQSIWDPTKENIFLVHGYAGGDDELPMVVLRDGAHVCGLISRYATFRLHRVVGLDPARPMITPGIRLSMGAAAAVHVIHTNAGHYGEAGRSGHVDFCINGGRIQPYCENADIDAQLCSHVWAVCYMSESLFPQLTKQAEPCSRRCPTGPRPGIRIGIPLVMGQDTPLSASGSYCVQDKSPPFCPIHQGAIGDNRCCLKAPDIVRPTNEIISH